MKRKRDLPPFAGVDWSVIDSPAFASLNPQAVRALLILARQFDGRNNGQLHASFAYCRPRGIRSQTTLNCSVAELIKTGLVYRTRSHGINPMTGANTPARYALTWQPLCKDRRGLFCDGFVAHAYRFYGVQKLESTSPKNWRFTTMKTDKNPSPVSGDSAPVLASGETPVSGDIELLAIITGVQDVQKGLRDPAVLKRLSDYRTKPRGRDVEYRQVQPAVKLAYRRAA